MQRAVGNCPAPSERPAEPQPAALLGLRHPAAHVPQAEGAALPASAHHGSQVGKGHSPPFPEVVMSWLQKNYVLK